MSGVNITEMELSNEKRDPNALGADNKQKTFLRDMFNEQERKSVKTVIDQNRRESKYTEVVHAGEDTNQTEDNEEAPDFISLNPHDVKQRAQTMIKKNKGNIIDGSESEDLGLGIEKNQRWVG